MAAAIEDQVVDFYYDLFDRLFSQPFRAEISQRLRRDAVTRQIQESAGAASQSLTRFFGNQKVSEPTVEKILASLRALGGLLNADAVSNPNVSPESLADDLLPSLPDSAKLQKSKVVAVYRVALHSVMQVLLLVGTVFSEWRKLRFAETEDVDLRMRLLKRIAVAPQNYPRALQPGRFDLGRSGRCSKQVCGAPRCHGL